MKEKITKVLCIVEMKNAPQLKSGQILKRDWNQ